VNLAALIGSLLLRETWCRQAGEGDKIAPP